MIKSTLILFLSFYMFASEAGSCTFISPIIDSKWTQPLFPKYLKGETCGDAQKKAYIKWINNLPEDRFETLMSMRRKAEPPVITLKGDISRPVPLNKGPFIKENARYEPDYLHGAELVADTPSHARGGADTTTYVPDPVPEPDGGGGGFSGYNNAAYLPGPVPDYVPDYVPDPVPDSGGGGSGGSVGLPDGISGGYNPYNCPACQCIIAGESGATQ